MRIKPNRDQLSEIKNLAWWSNWLGLKLKAWLYTYKTKKCKRIHKDLLDEAGIFLSDEQEEAILLRNKYKEMQAKKTVSVR